MSDKKEKATSVTYTLKAIKNHAKTLNDRKLISDEDLQMINEMVKLATEKWIENEFN